MDGRSRRGLIVESFYWQIEGFGAVLAHAYMRKLQVVNRGYAGEFRKSFCVIARSDIGRAGANTRQCKEILRDTLTTVLPAPSAIRTPKIKLLTIMLGANDSVLVDVNPKQHIPLDEYKQNLSDMLAIIRTEFPETRVILITPPPVDPDAYKVKLESFGLSLDHSIEQSRRYRDACLEAGEEASGWENDLAMIDTWELFLGRQETEYEAEEVRDCLSDGLHMSAKGNRLLGEALLAVIAGRWPELAPSALQHRAVTFDGIDVNNLPESLFANARSDAATAA
ncbi:isoamyl acetate-hydrolyzing esterase [Entophlyctis luteolus]|nr:isoamyl acetate-hydrolyzing esterase [Entophlyctis luteolus]